MPPETSSSHQHQQAAHVLYAGHGEDTPLLSATTTGVSPFAVAEPHEHASDDEDSNHIDPTRATVVQTMINIGKTCMGTGCLVLPFAARQGGLVLHVLGLLAIAGWNVYTVQRLCHCLELLPNLEDDDDAKMDEDDEILISSPILLPNNNLQYNNGDQDGNSGGNPHDNQRRRPTQPPEGTGTFGTVAWHAGGSCGLHALDLMMLFFLLGILITYVNAMRSFLRDTPLSTGSNLLDALATIVVMGPLSMVPHMGYLAKASGLGLLVLAGTFLVLAGYGLVFWEERMDHDSSIAGLSLWPRNGLQGVSHWFGCTVFSFGVVPLTYNLRSSMAQPHQMVRATGGALSLVAVAYMGVGIAFWMVFPSIDCDLLQELPMTGALPTITRLAMMVMTLVSAPLLIVPCGELLEGKLQWLLRHWTEPQRRVVVRGGICMVAIAVSVYVPGFVDVLSFVGCCCVAVVGFCIPPLLHATLLWKQQQRQQSLVSSLTHHRPQQSQRTKLHFDSRTRKMLVFDVTMGLWGFYATAVSTIYTFRQLAPAEK